MGTAEFYNFTATLELSGQYCAISLSMTKCFHTCPDMSIIGNHQGPFHCIASVHMRRHH